MIKQIYHNASTHQGGQNCLLKVKHLSNEDSVRELGFSGWRIEGSRESLEQLPKGTRKVEMDCVKQHVVIEQGRTCLSFN